MSFFKDKHKRRDIFKDFFSLLLILVLFVFASYLVNVYQPEIEAVIGANSFWGMLLFMLLFILSVVFTPISTVPLIPIGALLWGVLITTVLSVFGWTIGAVIAFSLARRFGRPYVSKIISLRQIEKVEKYIPEENIFLTIFFFRAVSPFDGLSYILGLFTRVKFRTFFWATLLGLIPFCFVMSYLGSLPTMALIIGLILASLFCIAGVIGIKRKVDLKK